MRVAATKGAAPGQPSDDEARIDALVRAERVAALFRRNRVAQTTVFLNSAAVAIVLWGRTSPVRLLAWVAVVWIVASCRLALGAAHARSARAPAEAERWARSFTLGAAMNGVAWGVAPFLLGAGVPPVYLIFFAFVLGGMAAGGALSNATHTPAFAAFAVPALVPITVRFLTGGDRLTVAMGALLVVFGAAVSEISRSGGRALADATALRFRNADLAERLSAFARDLETRVKERTEALESALARERESERQLARAARLASLGSLAAGVAHEINNPLTYVRSNVTFVRSELERGPIDAAARAAMVEALRDAGEGAERVRVIVRQLTDQAWVERGGTAERVHLRPVLDECAGLLAREIRLRATLHCECHPSLAVMGERSHVVHVVLDLLLNALQAVPEGNPAANAIRVAAREDLEAGEVVLEVSDTVGGRAPTALRVGLRAAPTPPASAGT
ncbi:MAG: sensor histidine kinase [Anaeromyxobacteraceae bacterium]